MRSHRHARYSAEKFEGMAKLFELAIANGTHSAVHKAVCEGCREWVESIYYTTFDGKRICGDCADKIGQGPRADAARLTKAQGGAH